MKKMKKVLMGSAFLAVIGIGITATQLSCSKTTAQSTTNYTLPPATTSTLGGIIVGSGLTISSNGTLSVNSTTGGLTQLNKILLVDNNTPSGNQSQSFVVINSDGTGKTIIPITLPTGRTFASNAANGQLSPDGKTLFFEVYEISTGSGFLYSCGLDGSNLKVIYTQTNGYPRIKGSY